MKSEQASKRTKSPGVVQPDTKEVLTELVRKLRETLDPKVVAASARDEHPRGGLRPNLNRRPRRDRLAYQGSPILQRELQGVLVHSWSASGHSCRTVGTSYFTKSFAAAGSIEEKTRNGILSTLSGCG